MLHNSLGRLKLVIMLDKNKGLLVAMPLVFGKENHSYCVWQLKENLMGETSKLGIRRASKELIQDMFNRLV